MGVVRQLIPGQEGQTWLALLLQDGHLDGMLLA